MSNARNLANLLSPGASTLASAAIADDAITAAKIDDDGTGFTFGDITVTNDIVGNVSGRMLLDASAASTDVGEEFLLDGTDGSATNAGSKIVFEAATDDASELLSKTSTNLPSLNFTAMPTINTADQTSSNEDKSSLGALVHLFTHVHTSPVSKIVITGKSLRIPNFDTYLIVGRITPSTDNTNLNLNFSYDGGVTFDTGNNYATEILGMGGSSSVNFNSGGALGIQNTGGGNGAGENTAFHFFLTDMLSNAYSTSIAGLGNAANTSQNHTGYIFGSTQEYDTTRNLLVSGLRFKQSSGNIENAEIKIFGLLPKHTGHIGDPNT